MTDFDTFADNWNAFDWEKLIELKTISNILRAIKKWTGGDWGTDGFLDEIRKIVMEFDKED